MEIRSAGRGGRIFKFQRSIISVRRTGGGRYRGDSNKARDSRKFPEPVESEVARTMLMEARCLTSTCPMRYFS